MMDIEANALITRGESSIAADVIKIYEASETSHKATKASHEVTVQTEGELWSANIRNKKTSDIWTYFKINSSEIKKTVFLTCEERVSLEDVFLLKSTQEIHSLSGEKKRRKESLNKTKGTKSIEIYGKKALNLQCKLPKSKGKYLPCCWNDL